MTDARDAAIGGIAAARPLPSYASHRFACGIRETIIRRSFEAREGHIGSCLSVADILAVLYASVVRGTEPRDPERDRVVLSKGHAALALYGALHERGWLPEDLLDGFGSDGTLLGTHPERALPGVDFSTGSLGHGLSYAAGAALAARMAHSPRRVFVLLSDAECNEGSVWEAAMFAAHHALANLTGIIDANGQQALGQTSEILQLEPLLGRWNAFGWEAIEFNGHDHGQITRFLLEPPSGMRPRIGIARTISGKGVSFMEGKIDWHYRSMSVSEYQDALAEVLSSCAEPSSGN